MAILILHIASLVIVYKYIGTNGLAEFTLSGRQPFTPVIQITLIDGSVETFDSTDRNFRLSMFFLGSYSLNVL